MNNPKNDPLTKLQARIQLASSAEIVGIIAQKSAQVEAVIMRSQAALADLEAITTKLELAHSEAIVAKCGYDVTHPLAGAISKLYAVTARMKTLAESSWGKAGK